eukprot:1949509-Pyramimonas_sp.AAC.1
MNHCHDVKAATRLDVHHVCHSSLRSRRRRRRGLHLRASQDRSAPRALEVDDHANRRVRKNRPAAGCPGRHWRVSVL